MKRCIGVALLFAISACPLPNDGPDDKGTPSEDGGSTLGGSSTSMPNGVPTEATTSDALPTTTSPLPTTTEGNESTAADGSSTSTTAETSGGSTTSGEAETSTSGSEGTTTTGGADATTVEGSTTGGDTGGSVPCGQPCADDSECAEGLVCLIVHEIFVCTTPCVGACNPDPQCA